MTDYILSSSPLNEIQNHDNFKVVWFGSNNYIPKGLTNFTDSLKKYYSFESCFNYINTTQSHRKILLVLTHFYQDLERFNKLPQIQSIYILAKNPEDFRDEKEKYSKLIHVFSDERILIERLRQEILLTYRNDLPISISRIEEMSNQLSLTCLAKTRLLFHWNQLFTYYLVHSSQIDMQKLKENMLKQCRLEYENNEANLKTIDEFETNCILDNTDNILEWYTKDSCVYRLVNKAFRTRNIDLICKFQYFIILLYNKLEELSIQQRGDNLTTVYRGQFMGKNELEMLRTNIGNLISTNTIMSTTRDQDVARVFVADVAQTAVIFEIDIRNVDNNNIYPFADISRFSKFSEKEVLFFAGAVFRIDSVLQEDNFISIIKLTLTNETTEHIEQVMNTLEAGIAMAIHYRSIIEKTNDYSLFNQYHKYLTDKTFSVNDIFTFIMHIDLNYLLNHSGDHQKMIKYYQELLSNKNFIDQPKFIILNILIGYNYFHLKEYGNALNYYDTALASLDDQNRLTAEVHNHFGDLWREKNEDESALLCYKEALKIIVNHADKHKTMPKIYRKIANIYRKQNNQEEVSFFENQANQIDEQRFELSEAQPIVKRHREQFNIELDLDIVKYAHKLYTDGMHQVRSCHFAQGLENLLQAEEFFKNYFCLYDHVMCKLAKLYEHAAFAYLYLKDHLKALIMWKKAIDIRTGFNYDQ